MPGGEQGQRRKGDRVWLGRAAYLQPRMMAFRNGFTCYRSVAGTSDQARAAVPIKARPSRHRPVLAAAANYYFLSPVFNGGGLKVFV